MKIKALFIIVTCIYASAVISDENSNEPPEFPFTSAAENKSNSYKENNELSKNAPNPQINEPRIPLQAVDKISSLADAENIENMVNESSPAKKKLRKKQTAAKNLGALEKASQSLTIKPKMGASENAIIALGKLNRISTPYQEPKVITIDSVETKIEGSDIYFATDSENTLNMYISDSASGSSVSLQLEPRELDFPVNIRIEQASPSTNQVNGNASDTGSAFHKNEPYLSEIKNIMRSLAQKMIPQGYTMGNLETSSLPATICHNKSLSFKIGQVISGLDSRIIVLAAQNTGSSIQMFEEAFCADEGVIAVAAWPRVRLFPGEKTEVYVLMRALSITGDEQTRPSLF